MTDNSGYIAKTLSSKSLRSRSFHSFMLPFTIMSHRSEGRLGTMRENASRVLTDMLGFRIAIQYPVNTHANIEQIIKSLYCKGTVT